jgi:hypothetical protein
MTGQPDPITVLKVHKASHPPGLAAEDHTGPCGDGRSAARPE